MSNVVIERAFLRIPSGRAHYRYVEEPVGTDRLPLYMAHAGPGCSRSLEPLIADLGQSRRVIAPDMFGNGDSDPPTLSKTTIGFYADCVVETLDALDIERVDFYGDHTGAQIGVELAIKRPDRVRRLVVDGLPLFPPEQRDDLLAHYAPEIQPDEYGGYLAWVWGFVRDLTLHFPYYRTDPEHRLIASPIIALDERHRLAVDVLKALPTYHLAYRAAFSQDTAVLLPKLRTPTLVMASDTDPLCVYVDAVAALIEGSAAARPARTAKAATIRAFLDDQGRGGWTPSR